MKKSRANKTNTKQIGFTLIEVMVAVAIFALAGGAIMKAVYEHLRSISTLEQITFATWVANNELSRSSLESRIKWPLDKLKNGEEEMAGKTWYWTRSAEKTADATLYQVTVSVSLSEDSDTSITSVTSFMSKVEP
jgi:general secretion pathway protein I